MPHCRDEGIRALYRAIANTAGSTSVRLDRVAGGRVWPEDSPLLQKLAGYIRQGLHGEGVVTTDCGTDYGQEFTTGRGVELLRKTLSEGDLETLAGKIENVAKKAHEIPPSPAIEREAQELEILFDRLEDAAGDYSMRYSLSRRECF